METGAPAFQLKKLPPIFCKNNPATAKHGQLVSDTIGVWVKKKFASGPFDSPPLANFRVNPLIAVEQHGKVRPVLNVSEPSGRSLNDNVDKLSIEKVYMSSAKDFGHVMCKAGVSANFSKFDLSDAYKNVPCKISDLRLQGFSWLGKYFLETQQIFGAISSVPNYDILGHTIEDVAIVLSNTPANLTLRRLDDVPNVAPASTPWCEQFANVYCDLCDSINVKLAPNCPNKDKAFTNEKQGKVLGIIFRSEDLSWSLPAEKKTEVSKRNCESSRRKFCKSFVLAKIAGQIIGYLSVVSFHACIQETPHRHACVVASKARGVHDCITGCEGRPACMGRNVIAVGMDSDSKGAMRADTPPQTFHRGRGWRGGR